MVLLRKVADRAGLTRALAAVLPKGAGRGRRDRGVALVQPAEPTGLRDLTAWPPGARLIVRRVEPSRRDAKKLTAEEADRLREARRSALPDHRHRHPRPPGTHPPWAAAFTAAWQRAAQLRALTQLPSLT
ncbi:hypothetical protein [Streptomyces sp. NPDC050121]|uniref:hypothetical protein n=1 Tax=Streptomyces sp. NPDC050121 TaxID=3365601 RepID=UPI0037A5F3BE